MSEEKKATCDVQVYIKARISYKKQCDNDIVMITFNMSDVPVDASDDMIKASALGHITDDLEKGTGVIKAVDSEGGNVCIIAIDSIKKFTVLSNEIKRGE